MAAKTSKRMSDRLYIQVFQGQALQCDAVFSLKSLTEIRIGKSSTAELHVPFAPFPTDLHLFKITKWGAKVRLDPRLDGFVSDGQRFGSVRDFIAPRGALKELATVLEPLEVNIPEGSRGALEISGYKIVFRVSKPKPEKTAPKIKGAPKAPFSLPHGQTDFEKAGFFLGVLSTVLVMIPAVTWFNKVPLDRFEGLVDLSPFLASKIIHPEHFQILPWAFSAEFGANSITKQAVQWVDDLRNKWDTEDLGKTFNSKIPMLQGLSVPQDVNERRRSWQTSLDTNWQSVGLIRKSAAPGTFLSGQNAYTPFSLVVAGGERGSIPERVKARLERFDRTYEAVVSLIETEHNFMRGYFKEESAEIPQIFDPPKEPGLFFRLAEKAFSDERANFHTAESFAALARKEQNFDLLEAIDTQDAQVFEQPFVWSGESLVLASVLNMPKQAPEILSGTEETLFKNVNLSLGKIAPPPAPKPIPKINMTDVEAFVRSRSPEVKACYDVALNRNPRLGGSIFWRWTITESGRVAKSVVERSDIRDNAFIGCLQRKIRSWTFPKPMNGAITLSFPFRFVVRENLDTLDRITR